MGSKIDAQSDGAEKAVRDIRRADVPVSRRAPILKAYLQVAPGARPHLDVGRDAPLAEFEKVAARYPVFRIVPD